MSLLSVRIAFVGAVALLVTAAVQLSAPVAAESLGDPVSQPRQLASYSPSPLLNAAIDDSDDSVAASDSAPQPASQSLRELVGSIAALPATDLSDDVRCLATAVYHESKGEPIEGQLAVAQVILNRVESGRYADTVCGVVRQPGQFTFAYRAPASSANWRTAQAVAIIAATGNWHEVVPDAVSFHAKRVAPGWARMKRVSSIGNHVFYAARR